MKIVDGEWVTVDDLISKHERILRKMLKPYLSKGKSVGLEQSDLFQAASIGLMYAYNKYDPSKGKFLTILKYYAPEYVKKEINRSEQKYEYFSYDQSFGEDDTPLIETFGSDQDMSQMMADEFLITLTEKERYILEKRMKEWTNTEIGKELGVSRQAVEKNVKKIRDKYRRVNDPIKRGSSYKTDRRMGK